MTCDVKEITSSRLRTSQQKQETVKRRDFITRVAGTTVERPFASIAQEAERIYRFGILEPFSDTPVIATYRIATNIERPRML
jgi:hypothetical protein